MTFENFTLVLAQEGESAAPGAPDTSSQTGNVETTGANGGPTPVDPNAAGGANGTGGGGNQGLGNIWLWMLPLLLVFFMLSMGGRKEKKKHAQMMATLGKGDRIRTTGGILGTVLEVRDDEVVVKVDESNNTKMRFARASIAAIVESKNAE